jgi:hypothetical protein
MLVPPQCVSHWGLSAPPAERAFASGEAGWCRVSIESINGTQRSAQSAAQEKLLV